MTIGFGLIAGGFIQGNTSTTLEIAALSIIPIGALVTGMEIDAWIAAFLKPDSYFEKQTHKSRKGDK